MRPTDDVHARGAAMVARACREHDEFADAEPLFRALWGPPGVPGDAAYDRWQVGRNMAMSRSLDALQALNQSDADLARAFDGA